MSAFTQYAPYELAEGTWDARREEIGRMILDAIAAYAPDVHDCVEDFDVLGPPDIESRIGLTGGCIFQGEVQPDQMWERRLDHRTPAEGLYLCGAARIPAASVIAAQRPQCGDGGAAGRGRPGPGLALGGRDQEREQEAQRGRHRDPLVAVRVAVCLGHQRVGQ